MKKKSHPNSNAAGAKNLAQWHKENPGRQQGLKHGIYSQSIRKRYSDLRTSEGKRLRAVMDELIESLGGPTEVSAGQNIILGNLRAKFIVLFQIGDYIDKQKDIIGTDADLISCMKTSFLPYSASVREDIKLLYGLKEGGGKANVPSLAEIINKAGNE